MQDMIHQTAQALEKRGFAVQVCENAQEAREAVLAMVNPGDVVGHGGSVTVRDIGVVDALEARGHTVYSHWLTPNDPDIFRRAADTDLYLASCNAVTTSGILVNIDRTGNRVAAMACGPRQVALIVGQNKLVDGGVPSAIARVKREACPPNARRLGLSTPCALTGRCNEAACESSLCGITSVITRAPKSHPVTVVLVREALGY